MGVAAHQAGKFEEAIALYNRALELPGSGAYRLSGTQQHLQARHSDSVMRKARHWCAADSIWSSVERHKGL